MPIHELKSNVDFGRRQRSEAHIKKAHSRYALINTQLELGER
jgi:hypothetical protein